MKISENHELTKLMIDHLADLYNIRQRREGIHLSTLIYCLTRSYYDNQSSNPIVPTDNEVMLFALGWGLQDVLTPKAASTPILEKDGILYSPDMVFEVGANLVELKTTRMSAKKGDSHEFPETWIEYMLGGCYITEKQDYDLTVLFMMGKYSPPFPMLSSYHFDFTKEEIDKNWDYILNRKMIYDIAVEENRAPKPFKWNKEFECKNCRYKLVCEASNIME